ncbi:MAG: tetratricopeptide repeat protein [Saprospiraceae bacterium]
MLKIVLQFHLIILNSITSGDLFFRPNFLTSEQAGGIRMKNSLRNLCTHFPGSFYLIFYLLFTFGEHGFGQSDIKMQDSIQIYALLDEADERDFEGNLDEALIITKKAYTLSQNKKMKRGEGYASLKLADLYLKVSQFQEIERYLDWGFSIGFGISDSTIMGLSFLQKSQYSRALNKFEDAISSAKTGITYFPPKKDPLYLAIAYNDIGSNYDKLGEYSNAAQNYLLALRIFESIGNEKETANTLGNLAVSYYRLNKREDAGILFKKSLIIREKIGDIKGISANLGNLVTVYTPISLDTALFYQEKALKYAKLSGTKLMLAQAYANTAALLSKQSKNTEALENQLKAAGLYEELGDLYKQTMQYIQCAEISSRILDSIIAEKYYEKAFKIATQQMNKPLLQAYYSSKSGFYKKYLNFALAYENLQLNYFYKDSIIDEKTKTNIEDLKLRYETEKKDLQLMTYNVQQKQKELEIEKQNRIIQISSLLNIKNKQEIILLKQDQEIKDERFLKMESEKEKQQLLISSNEQQLSISKQNLKILEQNNLLTVEKLRKQKILSVMTFVGLLVGAFIIYLLFNRYKLKQSIAEQTSLFHIRNNIAKDLHDEIGSTLTSIQILSHVSGQSFDQSPDQAKEMVHQIAHQSKTIQQTMSDIVWAIRPDNDKIEDLTVRMREFAGKTLEPKNIRVEFEVDEALMSKVLSVHSRKEILLIYKEVINNIIKHSQADKVKIRWVQNQSQYQLQINDNGSWKANNESTGTGMRSMKERAIDIGGQLEILTGPFGTEVNIILPVT